MNKKDSTDHYDLDEIDLKIIAALDEDVRTPYRALAKKLKVDQVTIRRRIDKLIESGVLRLGALLDYSKLGSSINVLFAFDVSPQNSEAVLQQLSELPQISWVSSVTGRFDLIALGRFCSHEEIAGFLYNELKSIKGIIHSETFVFLRRQKSFYSPFEKSPKSSFLIT